MCSCRHFFLLSFICLLLAGCAESETRSIVSKSDLPAHKYQKIAVFVEEPGSSPRSSRTTGPSVNIGNGQISFFIPTGGTTASATEIEQKVLSALGSAGVVASSGPSVFKQQNLSDQAKALIIQKEFQAVLYVTVEHGMSEENRTPASHDGTNVTFDNGEVKPISELSDAYKLKPDGSVYYVYPVVKMKSDLQDTKTNKLVWSAETIASGGTLVLSSKASEELVGKMRADGAI